MLMTQSYQYTKCVIQLILTTNYTKITDSKSQRISACEDLAAAGYELAEDENEIIYLRIIFQILIKDMIIYLLIRLPRLVCLQ